MRYAASHFNIIINIILLIVLLRFVAGVFGLTSSSSKTSQSTYNATKMQKKESRYQITKRIDLNDLYYVAEKGDIKARFSYVMISAGVVVFVLSSVFFIIQAFCVDVFWGVCVLLFNGIAILFFTIFHWNRARIPLLVYLAGVILLVVGAVFA